MKTAKVLFCILLAVIMVLPSAGIVFADDTPPPVDDQSLEAPSLTMMTDTFGTTGIGFNWGGVTGADKYILELQYKSDAKGWVKVINPTKITWTAKSPFPVPPTTVVVTTKKPFATGTYRWRVTAVNTDVGIDAAGTSQSSAWDDFTLHSTEIYTMYPQVTDTVAPYAYSSNVDQKKGEGTNLEKPDLYLYWNNMGGVSLPSTAQFEVVVKQGKNKWTRIVPASDCLIGYCIVHFSDFGSSAALTKGIPATWEVTSQDKPAWFGTAYAIDPKVTDVMEYNAALDGFNIITNAVVTDTNYTNKPTFGWDRVPVPAKGAYQFILEKYSLTASTSKWVSAALTTIDPTKTKIPASTALACNTTRCYWRLPAPLSDKFHYRWNVRVFAGGKYGPWALPTTPNFFVPSAPTIPEITAPLLNNLSSMVYPTIQWTLSKYDVRTNHFDVEDYRVDLQRISPDPLTGTSKVISILPTGMGCPGGKCSLDTSTIPEFPTAGLPYGIYQVTVAPVMKYIDGQPAVFNPTVKDISRFVIGPDAPAITGVAYTAVHSKPATSKLSVTFTTSAIKLAKNVKYRVLVAVNRGDFYQWVAIKTFSGKLCTVNPGAACTLEFNVINPVTKAPFAGEYYLVRLQEADADIVNAKKFGPFGPLGSAWTGYLP